MAEPKKIIAHTTTGSIVYCIITREADGYLLNNVDGAFADDPADPYLDMTEDGTVKGKYTVSESRFAWDDGRYTITAYVSIAGAGSENPTNDTVTASGEMVIKNDLEVYLDANMRGTDILNLKNFDPANDTVANVTVVATTTTNTDMRGTDNAALEATVNGLNNFDPANDTVANITNLTNKTGFILAATGLDAISQTAVGIIEIAKATWDRLLTNDTHNITKSAGKRIRGIEEYQGYLGGFIYIDTIGGSAGTESYNNGTLDNPVNNIADANTLSDALGISSFKIVSGSTLTFVTSQDNQEFFGESWTLNLGGQSISGTFIHGANVSGTCTATIMSKFEHCIINGVTLPPCYMDWCAFTNTIVIGSAGSFFFYGCHSAVAGVDTPSIDFGTIVADTNLNIRLYSGGIELKNIGQTGTDNVSIEGNGQIILNANCVAGTLAWRGHFVLNDNSLTTTITGDNIASGLIEVQAIAQKAADAAFGTYELDVANSQLVLKNESSVEVARWDLTPDYVNPSGKTRV